MTKFNVTKEEIIAEYMVGGISFRKIGKNTTFPAALFQVGCKHIKAER